MTVSLSEIINNKYDMQRELSMSRKNKRERKMAAARMSEYRKIEDGKRRMAEILKAGEGLCQVVLGKKKGTYEIVCAQYTQCNFTISWVFM